LLQRQRAHFPSRLRDGVIAASFVSAATPGSLSRFRSLNQYPSSNKANTMHTIAVEVINMTNTGRSRKP
jgi:hypothetical protein